MNESTGMFADLIGQSQDAVILVSSAPSLDELAVTASLSLALRQAGKNVRVAAPKQIAHTYSLVGLEEVMVELGNQNLLVSFDYSEEKVDKISYHIGEETKKFYLTIKPKKGVEPLDPSTVTFSRSGAEFDLIITVGVTDLESLDQLYLGYEDLFQNTQVISLNTYETSFGSLKVATGEASSLSEVVAGMLSSQSNWMSPDIATNLLYAIEAATNGLQSINTSAETFQVVANLLRVGGQRRWMGEQSKEVKTAPDRQGSIGASSSSVKKLPTKKSQETTVKVSRA